MRLRKHKKSNKLQIIFLRNPQQKQQKGEKNKTSQGFNNDFG